MATLSPMMLQYIKIKEENPDALLFFRVGDFYEMFFDDALTTSRELELTLTGKECGLEERAPMCGVPHHAVEPNITRLVEKGYKVAICDQVSDPQLSKGLVERRVTRIVTPGTIMDTTLIGEKKNNYLLSLFAKGKNIGISYCDISTGELFMRTISHDERALKGALATIAPSEIITNDEGLQPYFKDISFTVLQNSDFQLAKIKEWMLRHFSVGTLTALGVTPSHNIAMSACGGLVTYLTNTQKNALTHVTKLKVLSDAEIMPLDENTKRNLELTRSLRTNASKGTLLHLLDQTKTAMGGRCLRSFVEQPLISYDKIQERLEMIDSFYHQPVASAALQSLLENVYDMERLLAKVSYQTLNPRDCLSLLRSLNQAPEIKQYLETFANDAVDQLKQSVDPVQPLRDLLTSAICEDAPLSPMEGGVIKEGYSENLDALKEASTKGKQWLTALEQAEREATGIKNLKIMYNRVFGFYIEVTKSYYSLVPVRYIRKQTLTNAERYTTEELRNMEGKILGAQEQAQKLEYKIFEEIRSKVSDYMNLLQQTATAYKTLDALLSLATVARENHYVKPIINQTGELHIVQGRHPVVEKNLQDDTFVPNDTHMDAQDKRMQIITGPNMAGKSTYMRQVALIVLMAHMGSFVPAQRADIPLVDCVFTRVGASDDLASGQSTFMVEMSEMAYIMRNATANSLVILDEIGRGTSTFDGLSIAWSAVEYLCDQEKSGAKTLFATHYHELSELEGHLNGVTNYCVSVKEHGEEVIFLRTIQKGGADKSFGTYVARLAGVPKQVVRRAQEIQARLEANEVTQNSIGKNILQKGEKRKSEQETLFDYGKTEFIQEIQSLDVLSMSPMDAMNALFLIKEKALKL